MSFVFYIAVLDIFPVFTNANDPIKGKDESFGFIPLTLEE